MNDLIKDGSVDDDLTFSSAPWFDSFPTPSEHHSEEKGLAWMLLLTAL